MTKGIRKRQIILIIAIFVSSLVVFQNTSDVVSATSMTYSISFESGVVGNQYSDSFMTTHKNSGTTFAVSSYGHHTGLKCFESNSGIGFWNFTYSSSNYITNFSFWHSSDGGNIGASYSYSFFNKTHGSYNNPIIKIYNNILGNGTTPLWWYEGTNPRWLSGDGFYATWSKFYFNIDDDTGVVTYGVGTTHKTGMACNSSQVNLDYRIDSLYISMGGIYLHNVYDDLNFTVSDYYMPSGGIGTCDFTSFNSKGSTNAFYTSSESNRILHQLYRIPINTTIYGVELYIGAGMYDHLGYDNIEANDPSYYFLTINGITIGTATEIVPYGMDYLVRWCGISVTVTNEPVLFEFEQSTKYSLINGIYKYWEVGAYERWDDVMHGYTYDADGDGTGQYLVSGTYGYSGSVRPEDLAYKFYYGTIIIEPTQSPYGYDNLTVPRTTWYIGDSVPIAYFVQQSLYTNYVQVWRNGTQITDSAQGYPYTVPAGSFDGELSYVPLHIGNYQFRLVRNSVKIKSVNITVACPLNPGYIIYSYPNPYEYNTEFKIGYIYNNPTGGKGLILLGVVQDMNSTSDASRYWFITSNTSGNFTYKGTNNYYINLLYSTDSITFYYIDGVYQQLKSSAPNAINVRYLTYTLSPPDYKFTQMIFGSHKWFGFDVYVTINSEFIGNVGGSNTFSLTKEISEANTYQAKLMLSTVNGTIELASTTFSVSGINSPGAGAVNPWDALLGPYKYFFGIGIIVMFLFLPMTVASRLGMELPMIANLGSAALGMSFCVLSGLLPLYVIFFTVVAMVAGALIIMFMR
jgi:hypothetical protein